MLYFDHNATHPLSAVARDAWIGATERFIGNPSSPHRLGARAGAALDEAREKLAGWLGCEPGSIVWTSGATESNNAVLHHAARALQGEVWISAIEHPCVIKAARRSFGGKVRLIPVDGNGVLKMDWLPGRLSFERPALVALMAANNETGVLQPWREVAALCREREVPFLCDAAQWIGKLPAAPLGQCDFVSGCAHKFGGPQGVGFVKVPSRFEPMILGGEQEEGRRAGTENVPGVLAMIAALEEREAGMNPAEVARRVEMRSGFEKALSAAVPGVQIFGETAERLWNTVSVVLPPLADCRQRPVVKLDRLGFAVSTGSACSSGREKVSHVLTAMGVAGADRALRFSSGWTTTAADWKALAEAVAHTWQKVRAADVRPEPYNI